DDQQDEHARDHLVLTGQVRHRTVADRLSDLDHVLVAFRFFHDGELEHLGHNQGENAADRCKVIRRGDSRHRSQCWHELHTHSVRASGWWWNSCVSCASPNSATGKTLTTTV